MVIICFLGLILPSSSPLSDVLSESFRQDVLDLNEANSTSSAILPKTRIDGHAQFVEGDPFNAVQKTCAEMKLQ